MDAILENTHLNEQQVHMLRLLKKPLSEKAFKELRRLTVKLLGSELDSTIDSWEKDKNITEEYYEDLSKNHFRASKKKNS
ncbi:MAG: hypothetical protein DI598_19320 [Pseudopedobacter saltans]|uniref:Uncharacterized protein n=1 Tax=Pseudopedobacter saltans TaxID=151895 RepID=A0A2W5EH89_9SPHI|nr:MAG: hypothetical protein DI598_19320 [Pseudopedobacter saltans]